VLFRSQQIEQLRHEERAALEKVLTPAQKDRLKELRTGEPIKEKTPPRETPTTKKAPPKKGPPP